MFTTSNQLERRTAFEGLGIVPVWLATMPYCPGSGRNPRRGQSVGQSSQAVRPPSPAPSQASRSISQVITRPVAKTAPTTWAGTGGLGLSERGVDRAPYCRGGTARVWRELSSLPDWPYSQTMPLESTEAGAPCSAKRRSGYPALEGGALALAEKKAVAEGRRIVFVDETGCYLLPGVVRTFAPRGKTPVIREVVGREHLSAISGITPEGQLLVKTQDYAYHGLEAVCFLRHLLRHLSEKLLVIWDGNPIHRSNEIREFLRGEEGKDIQLEPLPGYAPELNPDEGIWNYLKRVELRNVVCQDMRQLFTEFRRAVQRLRRKPHIILACFTQAGLV
jgi:transposase